MVRPQRKGALVALALSLLALHYRRRCAALTGECEGLRRTGGQREDALVRAEAGVRQSLTIIRVQAQYALRSHPRNVYDCEQALTSIDQSVAEAVRALSLLWRQEGR
jgi:hypothetical protein